MGFSHIKDVPPVFDIDAYDKEKQLEKKLPGNQAVYDKRAMHETAMMNDFIGAFILCSVLDATGTDCSPDAAAILCAALLIQGLTRA